VNFTEAMLHVSQNERSAVIRPGTRHFVWYDPDSWKPGSRPLGLYEEAKDGGGDASRYQPSIEDILATDWEIFDLSLVPHQ
jgi:hypothetical protein